jgi:hypothetical protein
MIAVAELVVLDDFAGQRGGDRYEAAVAEPVDHGNHGPSPACGDPVIARAYRGTEFILEFQDLVFELLQGALDIHLKFLFLYLALSFRGAQLTVLRLEVLDLKEDL